MIRHALMPKQNSKPGMAIRYTVIFEPEADQDIQDQADYIMETSGLAGTAVRYVDRIHDFCGKLSAFPHSYKKIDTQYPDLRIAFPTPRDAVVYRVDKTSKAVYIIGVFNTRQNYVKRIRERYS